MMHYVLKLIIIATATILSSGMRLESSLGDTGGADDEKEAGEDAGGEGVGGEDAEDEGRRGEMGYPIVGDPCTVTKNDGTEMSGSCNVNVDTHSGQNSGQYCMRFEGQPGTCQTVVGVEGGDCPTGQWEACYSNCCSLAKKCLPRPLEGKVCNEGAIGLAEMNSSQTEAGNWVWGDVAAAYMGGIPGVARYVVTHVADDTYKIDKPLTLDLPLFDDKCAGSLIQTSTSNDASVGANASNSPKLKFTVDPKVTFSWKNKQINIQGTVTFGATFTISKSAAFRKKKTWVQQLAVFPPFANVAVSISVDLGMSGNGKVTASVSLPVTMSMCMKNDGSPCDGGNTLNLGGLSSTLNFEGQAKAHANLKIGLFGEAAGVASAGANLEVKAKADTSGTCQIGYDYQFEAQAGKSASALFNNGADAWNKVTGVCIDSVSPVTLSGKGKNSLGHSGCR